MRLALSKCAIVASRVVAALAGVLVVTVAAPPPARADLQVDGRWRQGALREDFTVQQWLPNGCGPTPQTGTSGGGEIIAIRMEGDELAFVGGGRVFRSNQCYDQMPTLARETHSRDANGKTWRTRCTTPPNDPRKAILNTLVVATSDTHIDMVETGRYEIVLETGRCVADVKRTRSFDLVPADKAPAASAAPPPVKEPPPKPEPKPAACESPGEPTRLEVRPSKKLMRTGEVFQFRGLVLDDKGCATRTPTTWKLAAKAPPGVTVDARGNVTVGKDVPEGAFEIVVAAGDKDTRVTVEVTSPARYDDLLKSSGLNASGENDAASVVTIASSSIGAGEGRVEDNAKRRRWIFIGIVGTVLVLLGIIGIVLRGRSRRAATIERETAQRHEAEVADVLERRRIQKEQYTTQKRAHEESLEAAARAKSAAAAAAIAAAAAAKAASEPASGSMGAGMMCPTCGRDYPAPTTFCSNDGAALVPASKAPGGMSYPVSGAIASSAAKRGKICPTCGDRSDGGSDYCGKDGTQLVLLN